MKKWISGLLAAAMAASCVPTAVLAKSENFSDVTGTEYYATAADALYELDILEGYEDGRFIADSDITRAEMSAVICRMLGMEDEAENAEGATEYDDVSSNHWASGYINVATEEGIIEGDGNGRFRPEDNVKHEEALKMVVCALGLADNVHVDPNDWSAEYLEIADDNSITDDLTSSKGRPAPRGDVAVMVYNGLTKDLEAPTASKEGGNYTGAQRIELSTATDGAEIYYTTDGSTPTVDSTKYTGAVAISRTTTLRAVSVLDGVLTSDEFEAEYTIRTSSGGGGGSSNTYTVSFDLNCEGATGAPERQSIKRGETANKPDDPEKEGYTFIGWYDEKGYSDLYNFDTAVTSDTILYAKWFDENDTTDTDGDGLTDELERSFGTDINKSDTDGDGLSDYDELNIFGYNPLLQDTDADGISDADEDYDEDGLTNIEEIRNGCSPTLSDSDNDMLSDFDEINVYGTNPCNKDTDGDGVDDGTEVECGSDPKVKEDSFETKTYTGKVDEVTPVIAAASVITDPAGAGTLSIEEVSPGENPLIGANIAGYLGSAYDFITEGTLLSAEITFEYDTSLGEIGDAFQPRIYYVNEETGIFEELPNQTVTNGSVSVAVTHFSTYILLNKVEFDKVWETEIKPQDGQTNQYTGIDTVFVIDSSGSMGSNDEAGLRKQAAKDFASKLGNNDRGAVIDFDSSASVYQTLTNDHDLLNSAIDRINSSGGTSLSAGISKAIDLFTDDSYTRTDAYKYIVFLTDGSGSYNEKYTLEAKDNNIIIYTIGLGSGVEEDVLKSIADGTGGKYYFASAANSLPDIYEEVSFETIDYVTDSNNDGISDYYTKLLNDGKLTLNGSYDLIDVLEIYGEENADWDNDGLKNGEEIQVCTNGNKVYAKMQSNPILKDTDGDGFSDYEELQNGTPRMKYTDEGYTYLDDLEKDNLYTYVSLADDRGVISNINAFFMFNKKDSAKNLYIEYFYDYAPEDSINKNKDKIAAAKSREIYLNYAQSFTNILKASKDICSTFDDLSKMAEGSSDTGNSKEFVDKLKNKSIKVEGASAQIRKSRKAIIDAINLGKFEGDESLKTILSDTEAAIDVFEEFSGEINAYDVSEISLEFTEKVSNLTSAVSNGIGTAKTVYEGFKYIKLDTGFKKLSKEYKNFVKSKGVDISTSTWIGVGIDVVSGGIDVWENCLRYGKMQANRDAYLAYIDLLYNIAGNADDDYDREAAGEIAEMIADESWTEYDRQLAESNTKIIASTAFETTFTIVSQANPYVALANAVYNILKLTISVTGLSNTAHAILNCRTSKSISDGCIYIINKNIETDDNYFSYDENVKEYVYSYIQQLAQSRIVGENYAKQRVLKNDLAAIISRWIKDTGKDDIDEMYDILIGSIYSKANGLNLELSPNLPSYSKFGI